LVVPLLKERIEELTKDNNQLRDEIKSLRKSDQEGGD
jgi:FtsZ-binding cell division protein ZapB